MTPGQASIEYGQDAPWSLSRGELFPNGRRITIKQLLEMSELDETMAAMNYAIETTMAQVNWRHEPRDNGEESDTEEALKAAEFADSLLQDMEIPLQAYVENALSYLVAGYSLAEILFRQRTLAEGSRFTDNLWGVRSIVERPQLTVSEWVAKDGKIVAYKQTTSGSKPPIPLAKSMHLTVKGGPNRPQGKSLFKAAYRMFQLKRRIQDSEAIGIERDLCGLPIMDIPQADIDAATLRPDTPEGKQAAARIRAAQAAVQDMRLNEAGGLVIPSDVFESEKDGSATSVRKYNFRIVTSAGSRSIDTRGAIREYDLAIARIAMMQFLRLGDRAGGSYALSDTQSSLALRSIMAIVQKIAFEWRLKVLTTVFLLNGMDLRYLPELGTTSITEDSLEEVGAFLESLASAQELLEGDDELMEDMKQRLGPRRRRKKIFRRAPAVEKPETEPADA